jgi:hypothetical protein
VANPLALEFIQVQENNMKQKIKSVLAFLALVLLCTVTVSAAPFRQSFTLANTAGSYTVTNVYNSVSSGANFSAIVFGNSATGTVTLAHVSGTSTNVFGTKVITATDKTFIVTNLPSLFIGDRIRFTTTDTGTNTSYVIGEEF